MTNPQVEQMKAWAERLVNRDESVVAELYDAFGGNLYSLLCKMVHDQAIAADLLQEGFVKIWKYGAKYDPKRGSLFTWMMNICRNGAIDHLRSKKTEERNPRPQRERI